ncbi:MAG: DUF3179 domain-containing (seleno)protein, partial [Saprospiraceae bacterium]
IALTAQLIALFIFQNYWYLIPFSFVLILIVGTFIVRPENIFPALRFSEHKNVNEIDIDGQAEIIGILVNNIPVAYPLWELVAPHHIINDKIGDAFLAVSFCPACRSAIVYSSMVENQTLVFEVAGLYRKNMPFSDIQTRSIWQQATGEAIYGKLKGTKLNMLFFSQTTLQDWKQDNPKTLIAVNPENAKISLVPKRILKKLLQNGLIQKINLPGIHRNDKRLNPHEEIIGITIGEIKKAYPLTLLKEIKSIYDKIGNIEIELKYYSDSNKVKGRDITNNHEILIERHWWLAWSEMHPDTEL